MSGLRHLFYRILPIITLVCFISFGILQIVPVTQDNPNITYLEKQQINIGTEQNPEYKELYTLDMISYTENLNQDILTRSINKVFTFEHYMKNLNKFDEIWEDGYQIFDVSKTIANGVVLTINTIILPINIILIPIRLISGILLTGMSAMGINVNNGKIVIPTLQFLVDQLAIPYIGQQEDENLPVSYLAYTNWAFENNLAMYYEQDEQIEIEFTSNNRNFNAIKFVKENNNIRLYYRIGGVWEIVYDNYVADYITRFDTYKYITISENKGITQQQEIAAAQFLNIYAREL